MLERPVAMDLAPGPFDAFLRLRAAGLAPALFETMGAPGTSIVPFAPAGSLQVAGGKLRMRFEEAVRAPRERDPLDAISRLRRTYLAGPSSHPFTGGLAGYFGYEWSAAQEGPDSRRQEGVPDLWFGLFDRALVWSPGSSPVLVLDPRVRDLDDREAGEQVRAARRALVPATDVIPRTTSSSLKSDFPRARFEAGVRRVKRHIRRGDIYQANVAHRVRARSVDPLALYAGLRLVNPSPFMGIVEADGFTIVSGSPERLLEVRGAGDGTRMAATRPIAGTRPRGPGAEDERLEREMRESEKERAEHVMLVDLERNDLGRVCEMGSVEVDEFFTVERYSHVMHLVSNVKGALRGDVGVKELARAMLPGGTVTGCPKIRATEVIREVEPVPRGAYTGSMGYFSFDGQIDMNILIRSAYFPRNRGAPPHSRDPPPPRSSHGECHIFAGSGIVQDSDPAREWRETMDKADALLSVLAAGERRGFSWSPPRKLASWKPPGPAGRFENARVLVIDNYDSFTYNLVQYVAATGARVDVVRNDQETVRELVRSRPTHVIISPGPGTPRESGVSVAAARAFEGTPLLGVCLGLQAMVEAYGGRVGPAPVPVHGKASVVRRASPPEGRDILSSLPREFEAARYHSLAALVVKRPLEVTAVTLDGVVMAVRHRDAPTFGVQFHPESVLTPTGMRLMEEFLGIGARTAVPEGNRPQSTRRLRR